MQGLFHSDFAKQKILKDKDGLKRHLYSGPATKRRAKYSQFHNFKESFETVTLS